MEIKSFKRVAEALEGTKQLKHCFELEFPCFKAKSIEKKPTVVISLVTGNSIQDQ